MKIKKGSLLTVILAMLCAVTVALGVGFALPKAEKITAEAAVAPSVTATFTDGGVSRTYSQATGNVSPPNVPYTSMNPDGKLFGSTTSFSRTPANTFDMYYAGGYATVKVPAHTEYILTFTADVKVTRSASGGSVSKTYCEVLYYGNSDLSSTMIFSVGSTSPKGFVFAKIEPASQISTPKAGTDTKSTPPITVTNDTDSAKDYDFYFGVQANTGGHVASGGIKSSFTATAIISLDPVQVTKLDVPKVTSANNTTPTDDATEKYKALGNVFTFNDCFNTGKAFHSTGTDDCVVLKSISFIDSDSNVVDVTSSYPIASNSPVTLTDIGKYIFTFELTTNCGAVWDSSTTNDQTDKTVTITIKQAEITVKTTPTAPSGGYQWELGDTGSLALNILCTDPNPNYDLECYYVKTSDAATHLTTGLNTTTGALDVSQITSTGTYKLCVKLKDTTLANKNYTIKDATAGIYEIPFTIGSGAIDFSVINWQYSEGSATNPLYDLFVGGSQQNLVYKYDETTKSTIPYFITADIPAGASSYLTIDTTYSSISPNGNSFNCGYCIEYLGLDGTSTPVPVLYADKAGRYRTLVALNTDIDHLFTNNTNYGLLNSAGTKGWYEVNWTVSKATVATTDLTALNTCLQWRIPGETGWQNFDPTTTTLAFCGKEIEVQVDPSAYPHGITGVDLTYGDNGYTNAKGTNGNTYTATVKYAVDDNYNPVAVQTFTWTIGSLVLNPAVNSYTYSGGEVNLKSLMNLTVDQWEYVTISSGTSKATDVDDYTAVLTIKPEYFGGVVWSTSNIAPSKKAVKLSLTDGASASADCTVKWKIVKAILNGAWGDAEGSGKVPPVNLSSASVADIPSELIVYTYKDLLTGQTVDSNKLQGGREYEVTVGLNTNDPRSNNYIFNAPAAYRITTPETRPNLWQKVSNFMTQPWMGMPIWAWFLIGLALLILLIIIIAVACKRRKTKEEKAEIKAAKEEEKVRREEERQRQEEERRRREEEREEEKRRREEERADEKRRREEQLEHERELAKAKQEAELEKIRAQQAANVGMAGMASMAMAQPQQQQAMPVPPQSVQQVVDNTSNELLKEMRAQMAELRADNKATQAQLQAMQNSQQNQPQPMQMPMYQQQPMYPQYPMYQQMPMQMPYGGGNDIALARMEAQLNTMQAEQRARYDAEQRIELAAMRAESHVDRDSRHSVDLAAMREHINGYNYSRLPDYSAPQLPYNNQSNNMDMMGALVAATLKNMANGEAAATQVPELPQNSGQSTPTAKYPSDAVITTTTTVDTTKNKPIRREENFDVDGFYDTFE